MLSHQRRGDRDCRGQGLLRFTKDQGQAALALVLGIVLIMALGTAILANTVDIHGTIVENSVFDHDAYRALQTGITNFDYELNANFSFLKCNSSDVSGSDDGQGSTNVTTATTTSGCTGANSVLFRQWQLVPGTNAQGQVPEYYLIGNPQFSVSSGSHNVTVEFIGAAGYANNVHYQKTNVTFVATNQFILNLYWSNYDEVDPGTGGSSSCSHFDWAWGSTSTPPTPSGNEYLTPSTSCTNGNANFFVTNNQIDGPVFANDSIYVDGSPPPVFEGPVVTADPYCLFVDPLNTTTDNSSNCSSLSENAAAPSGSQKGAAVEPLPTTNTALLSVAIADGCVYEGPTAITLQGSTMTVANSYMTAGGLTGKANDSQLDGSNQNQCLPYGASTSIPIPANGVIYVEDAPNSICTSSNSQYNISPVVNEYEVTSGYGAGVPNSNAAYGCRGDAIVEGDLYGNLTIATSNNVITDGSIVYCTDPTTPTGLPGCSIPNSNQALSWPAPSYPGTSSVLGMIANEYVEVNNPVPNGSSSTAISGMQCTSNHNALSDEGCWQGNTVIDAAILALNHSYVLNNWSNSPYTTAYSIVQYGAAAEDYFELFGAFQAGGKLVDGYNAISTWDSRFAFFGPPSYLKTGVNGNLPYWNIASTDVVAGATCSSITLLPPVTEASNTPLNCSAITFP